MLSLGNSIHMLDVIMDELKCSIVCIREHWQTKEQLNLYKINDYRKIADYCIGTELHGGSAVYAPETISKFHDLDVLSEDYVFKCASGICNFKNYKCVVIMQIDTLSNSKACKEFKNILNNFNAKLTIKDWTRITNSTKSCLINIITICKEQLEVKVIQTDISDHLGQTLKFEAMDISMEYKTKTRDSHSGNILFFCNKLGKEAWLDVYNTHEVNQTSPVFYQFSYINLISTSLK